MRTTKNCARNGCRICFHCCVFKSCCVFKKGCSSVQDLGTIYYSPKIPQLVCLSGSELQCNRIAPCIAKPFISALHLRTNSTAWEQSVRKRTSTVRSKNKTLTYTKFHVLLVTQLDRATILTCQNTNTQNKTRERAEFFSLAHSQHPNRKNGAL